MAFKDTIETLKGAAGLRGELTRIGNALERIAAAAETLSGGSKNSFRTLYTDGKEDGSWVGYVDDAAQAALEERQMEYLLRTGIRLPEGQAPPGPVPDEVQVGRG